MSATSQIGVEPVKGGVRNAKKKERRKSVKGDRVRNSVKCCS